MKTKVAASDITADLASSQCKLMKGNIAMVEAAVAAECRYFFGYPITPQNEVPARFAELMPAVKGTFVQAESEVAAINMVYGAAAAGGRVMTSSSSPGISLKQEGISYIAAAELPCVIANMMRGGPGLGNIAASQSDYFQSCKGGGHGDYRLIVLAPSTVQELADLTFSAFTLAEKWRNPVMLLGDAVLAQITEPVVLPKGKTQHYKHDFILDGCRGRKPRVVRTLWLKPDDAVEQHNIKLQQKYKKIAAELNSWEEYCLDDAEVILTAYGSMSRIIRRVVDAGRHQGLRLGMLRPVTLWPFCTSVYKNRAEKKQVKYFLTVEMSYGQLVEDVKLSVNGCKPVYFYGRSGGGIPAEEQILAEIKRLNSL
ncbi:MAG TPA: 3-methyl-2-oxobutanoate dehydrogenase subunit VorB [Spirochaetota bacterium]|nr:3-methyl-2-oxobutanoate dehydrogenase subunit VorB [Spirochaetota bacterium]